MTDTLSRLAELAEKSTPGEWERGIGNDSRFVNVRSGPRIAEVYGPWDGFFVAAACNFARTELPALVAELKRLQAAWQEEHTERIRLEERCKQVEGELKRTIADCREH